MPQRLLIIEDDPVSRELLSVLLAVEGFDVLLAESGEEALQQLRSDAVDVILTDMQMPGISGAELAGKLRTVCGKKDSSVCDECQSAAGRSSGRIRWLSAEAV